MKKFVAITTPGTEYLYKGSSAHSVSCASAEKILSVLNRVRYKLKDGEIWHVYIEEGSYSNHAAYQSFTIRKGIVSERWAY